jgi:hypothetical protein
MAQWSSEEYQELLAEVGRRSSIDPEFRKLALTDSISALSKVSGKAVPSDPVFKFVDNSGHIVTIPLPDPIEGIEVLSEEELEAIAGGNDAVGVSWSR